MGVLAEDLINTEAVPLHDLGVNVWLVVGSHDEWIDNAISRLRYNLMFERGLSISTESILTLIRKEFPKCPGMDIYDMPPAICVNSAPVITLPKHYWCKVPIPEQHEAIEFILVADGLIKNSKQVYDLSHPHSSESTLFFNYGKRFIKIKEETLLDFTGDDRSLYAVGAFLRTDGRGWRPLETKDAGKLSRCKKY